MFAPAEPSAARPAVNNSEGLAAALQQFAWPGDIAWVDTLVVQARAQTAARSARRTHTSFVAATVCL